jgi:hypothetical protein
MKQLFKNIKPPLDIIKVCETCKYAAGNYIELSCINRKSKNYGKNLIEYSSCDCWGNDAELINHSKRKYKNKNSLIT